jgi:O-acetyl-ADP-ribose deacetylase (regulator of RNase III)
MGSGIALKIARLWPSALSADKLTGYGDSTKLGTYSQCTLPNKKVILNCYTQYNYGYGHHLDYEALYNVLSLVKDNFSKDLKIGMPKIGCRRAGGDWFAVSAIIDKIFDDRTVYVYEL